MANFPPLDEQLAYITKGAAEIVKEPELRAKLERSLASGKPLRVKAGFDPTSSRSSTCTGKVSRKQVCPSHSRSSN